MRLIDADAFLKHEIKRCDGEMPFIGTCSTNNFTLKSEMDKFPTFDAEPLRHGHWEVVDVGTSFYKERKCSCCKQVIKSNYWEICPNCGAKMDEVSE